MTLSSDSVPELLAKAVAKYPPPDFDLSQIRAKVTELYTDWNSDRIATAEREYRTYLAEYKATKTGQPPSPDVVVFWRMHSMCDQKYLSDFVAYFGFCMPSP